MSVVLGEGYQVDFGDALDSSNFASVLGTVFEDLNGNGQWDATELGIAGVTVHLDDSVTTTTDQFGNYSFITAVAGIHVVSEIDPADYFSTTPNRVNIMVAMGASHRVDFGDAPVDSGFATIYGTVFANLDGNGQQDANELGIPNVTVTLDGNTAVTTNQNGGYTFSTTVAGVHTVVESDLAGYFSTTPNEVHVNVILGNGYQVDFGDAPFGSGFANIYGTAFEDANSNGEWDTNEVGISGVTVSIDGTNLTTDQYGSYTFMTLVAGTYNIVETDLPGYVSTTPNIVNVTVVLDNGYEANFGDIFAISCDADVFEENDSVDAAGSIMSGAGAQAHNFCEDATDWTSFTAEAGTTYTITTSAWGTRADTFLGLYDTDGETLLQANDDYEESDDFSSRIVWEAAAAGTYFVQTTNKSGLTGGLTEYDLSVVQTVITEEGPPVIYLPYIPKSALNASASARTAKVLYSPDAPNGEINHSCMDSYELDDTWQTAQAINLGEVQTHSFDSNPALYAADKDYVWVDLNVGETAFFTITETLNTQTVLELVDEAGQVIHTSDSATLDWTAATAVRYTLGVSPGNTQNFGFTDTVSYELTVDVTGGPPAPPIIYLPFITMAP